MLTRTAVTAIALMGVPSAIGNDLLPLNDGLYVTDARLCSMSLQDMFHPYGDLVGATTRTVDGRTFSSNYESSCETSDVSQDGDEVTFDLTCSGEGEEWTDKSTLLVSGKDGFTDDIGREYARCDSDLTRETVAPTTRDLIVQWQEANSLCRGSSDPDTSLPNCGARDVLTGFLEDRGWCYTQPHWSGADNMWHVCIGELFKR